MSFEFQISKSKILNLTLVSANQSSDLRGNIYTSFYKDLNSLLPKGLTFKHEKFIINPQNQLIVLVPKGFGNAHLVRSKEAVYYYKCAYEGSYVDAKDQFTYAYNDERIGVDWGVEKPILSERDMLAARK